MEWKQIPPETFSPREKIPIMEGEKKIPPPWKNPIGEFTSRQSGNSAFWAPSVVGWPVSGTGSPTLARSTGKKTRPQAVNQAHQRWRRCLPTVGMRGRSNRRGLGLCGRGTVSPSTVWLDRAGVLPPPLDEHLGLEQQVERSLFQARISASNPTVRWLGRPGTRSCCVSRCSDHLPLLTAPR